MLYQAKMMQTSSDETIFLKMMIQPMIYMRTTQVLTRLYLWKPNVGMSDKMAIDTSKQTTSTISHTWLQTLICV